MRVTTEERRKGNLERIRDLKRRLREHDFDDLREEDLREENEVIAMRKYKEAYSPPEMKHDGIRQRRDIDG
jgi:hypothetical protein